MGMKYVRSTRLFVRRKRMALGAASTNFRMPKITCPDSIYDKTGHHNIKKSD